MTVTVVRGGSDTPEKLRRHAERTARAWSLNGRALLGVSVFAVLDGPLDDLLRQRFTNFRDIHLSTAGRLASHGFELLPTGLRPHFTVRLRHASEPELGRLLAALGDAHPATPRSEIYRLIGPLPVLPPSQSQQLKAVFAAADAPYRFLTVSVAWQTKDGTAYETEKVIDLTVPT